MCYLWKTVCSTFMLDTTEALLESKQKTDKKTEESVEKTTEEKTESVEKTAENHTK